MTTPCFDGPDGTHGPGGTDPALTTPIPNPPGQPPVPNPPGQPPVPTPSPGRNTIGLVALVAAILGAIFACIPGALIVGWILLPVAFVLGVVSLFQNASKKPGTWAIVVSVVGTILGVIVSLAVLSNAVDDAFGDAGSSVAPAQTDDADSAATDDTTDDADSDASDDADTADDTSADDTTAALGTRENPAPIGSVVTGEEWEVTITSFDPDATEAVLAANQFNQPPAEGKVYALVGVSATYTGPDSSNSFMISVDYVTATGEVITISDTMAVGPEPSFGLAELFTGGTETGSIVLEIPAEGGGVLRVSPGFLSDPVFIATS